MARRAFRHLAGATTAPGAFSVPGLYAALLEGERRRCSRPDPRLTYRLHGGGFSCRTPGIICEHDPLPLPRSQLLDDLEAGRPVHLQGRQLRGHSLPDARLRRDQAFDWFEVRTDDSLNPVGPQE